MTTTTTNRTMIDVAGTQVEMFSGGSGPPLLFLHGAGGNAGWQALPRGTVQDLHRVRALPSRVQRHRAPRLALHHHRPVPLQPGHGGSPGPHGTTC